MLLRAARRCLNAALSAVPIAFYQRLIPCDVIGFCYHMVSDGRPAHTAHLGRHKTAAQFEADLAWLKQRYRIITYQQLCELREQSGLRHQESASGEWATTSHGDAAPEEPDSTSPRSARRPAAVVTFDDGLREHLTVVKPLLARYQIPAIFFVTTDFIDNRAMFYRHRVSLCVENLTSGTSAQLAVICAEVRRRFGVAVENTNALIKWLKSLTKLDEETIDTTCKLLEIDWPSYLRGHRPYLTSDEIQSLAADGYTIGAHGKSHVRLSDLEGRDSQGGATSTELRPTATDNAPVTADNPAPCSALSALPSPLSAEIADSCHTIADLTGADAVPFAFPFSGDGVRRTALAALRHEHPEIGLLFDRRGFQPDAPFIVHRIISDEPTPNGRSNFPRLLRREYRCRLSADLTAVPWPLTSRT